MDGNVKQNRKRRRSEIILYAFLAFTIFFPTSYNAIKLTFFSILLLASVIEASGKVFVPTIVLMYVSSKIIGILIGLATNAPGALRTSTTGVIYPLAFSYIFCSLLKEDNYKSICKVILYASTFVAIYDIVFALATMFNVPLPGVFYIEELEMSYSNYYGYAHFTTRHINVLFFSLPMCYSLLLKHNEPTECVVSRRKLWTVTIIQVFCAILASRVALLVIVVLAPFLILIFRKRDHGVSQWISKKRAISLLVVSIVVMALVYHFREYVGMLFDLVVKKISIERSETSTAVRSLESKALIDGWLSSPIFGHGSGSYTVNFIRDPNMPWAYELSYHALLYQNGLFGFVFTMIMYIYILRKLLTVESNDNIQKDIAFSFFTGLLSFLIANSVDPYLGKFGFMWVLFLPLSMPVVLSKSGESVRKLNSDSQNQEDVVHGINLDRYMMWEKNRKTEFSDDLGGY